MNKSPEKYKFIGMVIPAGLPNDNNSNDELIVSVCININKYCSDFITDDSKGNRIDEATIQKRYNDFYDAILKLKKEENNFQFKNGIQIIPEIPPERDGKTYNPFIYYLNNELNKNGDYKEIKDKLWSIIFPSDSKGKRTKTVHTESSVKIYNHKQPDLLLDISSEKNSPEFHLLSTFSLDRDDIKDALKKLGGENENKVKLNERLKQFHEFGGHNEKIAKKEREMFHDRYKEHAAEYIGLKKEGDLKNLFSNLGTFISDNLTAKTKIEEFLLNPSKFFNKAYVEHAKKIEIDELVHSFSVITSDPVLSRIMGLTKDYKISLKDISSDEFNITLEYADDPTKPAEEKNIYFLTTPIKHIRNKKGDKHGYLIYNKANPAVHFHKSILKKENTELISFDLVSKVQKLEDHKMRLISGQEVDASENKESLTRGILFTHKKLDEIIKPVDIIQKDQNGKPSFIDKDKLGEEHFVSGHRVIIDYDERKYSLTSRSVDIFGKGNEEPLYYNGVVESSIHLDAPTAYMENGEIKTATSNVLFEYSGELLKLKSAFSKCIKRDKVADAADKLDNNHDDGVSKSQERFNRAISFYYFPKLTANDSDEAAFNCIFGIPENFSKNNAPQLRYGKKYTFAVYHEYQNGWGLPLKENNSNFSQLTIEDLLDEEPDLFFPSRILFRPLENKKAPQLYHRNESHDDMSKPIAERASLEHIIVRSNSGSDTSSTIDERHVLPPKIDIEPAFWYGLLSSPNMTAIESFEIKRRANCSFIDKSEYQNYTNEKDSEGNFNKCPEGCTSYCGGTQMEKFYPERHIYPRFLTDRSVEGFIVKLFWDQQYAKPVFPGKNKFEMYYGGEKGIKPESILLCAAGSHSEIYINDNSNKELIEIFLKKGAQVYGHIQNLTDEEGEKFLTLGWWKDISFLENKIDIHKRYIRNKNDDDVNRLLDERNVPKKISLTHAVKEPLIVPEVIKLTSTPKDHKLIEHLYEWLNKKEYKQYKIGVNIIGNRIDKNKPTESLINSSFTQVELSSHFERLDAFRKIEFLKEVIPTGVLELWMRKEVFVDDPDQIVLSSNSATNHLPNEPVVGFKNPDNVFTLEHKIEFSNEILSQLKDLKNIEDIDSISDVFRSLITKLNLQYDFKTTCFEEREYYLKNISKFKGFFTDEVFNDNGEVKAVDRLEEYALPKIKDVMRNLKNDSNLRFKVITLNNSQPSKPDVALAVTTTQEKRSNPSHKKTISVQKGNIVTIYLKRGRLKSGKDERAGVIVDADSLYNKLFKDNDLISKAGRDIVSDRYSNRSQYLQYGDIIIPEDNEYKVEFDNELGIYHFLPKFDVEKQLWKFEVELDIKTKDGKQLHNPFINFSIVHFQPFSINYNDKTAGASLLDIKNDCRISDVENSTWCYLLPERKLSVYFNKPNLFFNKYGEVALTVSFDHESLHHFNSAENVWKVRSNFIVTVQGSHSGKAFDWNPVKSWLDTGDDGVDKLAHDFHHPLLSESVLMQKENLVNLNLKFSKNETRDEEKSSNYSHFRVRLIEVEWFKDETWDELKKRYEKDNPDLLKIDVLDNEEMRIRYVELIY